MLKKILIFSMLCVSSMNVLVATQTLDQAYITEMDQAIQKAENHVQELIKKANRSDASSTWESKIELDDAIRQVAVKKMTVEHFKTKGAILLESPEIRAKLIQTLNKELIDQNDLDELRNTINTNAESLLNLLNSKS